MFSKTAKHEIEVAKVASMLKYRGVRPGIRMDLAKRYDSQYILAQCKQQERDAKTKFYRSVPGDLVARIRKGRATPDYPVQAEPDRRPHKTCPFVEPEKCEFCFWHYRDEDICIA